MADSTKKRSRKGGGRAETRSQGQKQGRKLAETGDGLLDQPTSAAPPEPIFTRIGKGQCKEPETMHTGLEQSTAERLKEVFGEEGSKIVNDFVGQIAESVADSSARAAFEEQLRQILEKKGVAEAYMLFDAIGRGSSIDTVATIFLDHMTDLSNALGPDSLIDDALSPALSSLTRLAAWLREQRDRGLSLPAEIAAVSCSFCGFVFALGSTEYVTFHGPVSVGEAVMVTAGPVRACSVRNECLAAFFQTTGRVAADARRPDVAPRSPLVYGEGDVRSANSASSGTWDTEGLADVASLGLGRMGSLGLSMDGQVGPPTVLTDSQYDLRAKGRADAATINRDSFMRP